MDIHQIDWAAWVLLYVAIPQSVTYVAISTLANASWTSSALFARILVFVLSFAMLIVLRGSHHNNVEFVLGLSFCPPATLRMALNVERVISVERLKQDRG